eukprot:scaffold125640_cov15-Tisochrysis_lutea.AAC.1
MHSRLLPCPTNTFVRDMHRDIPKLPRKLVPLDPIPKRCIEVSIPKPSKGAAVIAQAAAHIAGCSPRAQQRAAWEVVNRGATPPPTSQSIPKMDGCRSPCLPRDCS